MKESILVKTDMGDIQCNYLASELIEGAGLINTSLEKMRQLLEATYPRKQLGEIEYQLYSYESKEINAFSVYVEEGYVIAFSTAVFIQFYRIIKNLFMEQEICKWFKTTHSESEQCINAIYDYMTWFIAFHELFHVINGHCKYMTAKGVFNVEQSTEENPYNNLITQILESDADYCAVIACVNFIFIQAKNKGAFDEIIDVNIRDKLIKATEDEVIYLGFAVYHTFLLFSSKEKGKTTDCINSLLKYDHPYSSIRMSYCFMTITHQMNYFLSLDEVKRVIEITIKICIAYDRIYYADGSFDKSLLSLAFTEKGVQHIKLLHNNWNNIIEELKGCAHIMLKEKENINKMHYWVNDNGTMMKQKELL